MRRLNLLLSLLLLCCGGAPSSQTKAKVELPSLDGRPVYDVPLEEADSRLQEIWTQAHELLSQPLPARELSQAEYGGWVDSQMKPWFQARVERTRSLAARSETLSPAPRDQLFRSILIAHLLDDLVTQLHAMPVPSGIKGNPEMESVYRDALKDAFLEPTRSARDHYQRCADLVAWAPAPQRVWGDHCSRRAEVLDELTAERESVAGVVATAAMPPECEGDESWPEVQAPPPDEESPRKLVVLYTGSRLDEAQQKRLLAAVRKNLRRRLDIPLLSEREMRAAKRLHGQRRLHRDGPVCGQAPPLPAIIAESSANLVLAQVRTACIPIAYPKDAPEPTGPTARCSLSVEFARGGTDDRSGLPSRLEAELAGTEPAYKDWVEAVGRLNVGRQYANVLGALRSGSFRLRVFGHQDESPWLRVAPTLHELRDELAKCHEQGGTTSLEAKWNVSPEGRPLQIQVVHKTAAKDVDGGEISDCVARVLESTAWPCTRSGKLEAVDVRICVGR